MSATFGPQVPRCHLSGARHKGTERTQSWHISRGGEGHGERPAWAGGLQSLCAAQGSLSRTGWKRGVGRPSASWASSLCQPQTCPHPQNDTGPLAPLEGPGPQEGLLLPPLSADHLSRAFPEPGWSCQPQQCPPHTPLPTSTGRGWPEARSGTCIPRRHASPLSAQCPPSTQKAGPLLCRPHPARKRGLWTRALGAQSQLRHPSPTRAGKFAGGGPRIPQPASAASKRAQDLSRTVLHPYPGPTPPRPGPRSGPQKQLDPPGGGGGQQEGSCSRPLPARARTRRPGQRRPRAFTEPRAQQQERRGTYCASAGRLPRPLSPKRRRRRGTAAVRAGALLAAGPGLGLGLGLRLGRHRPADSEARGGLRARRARRADTAPRGGAARGERCHSCFPHHTPCPPRAGRGPGARARGQRRAAGAGRGAGAQSAGRRAHSVANRPAPRWPGQSIIHCKDAPAASPPHPHAPAPGLG